MVSECDGTDVPRYSDLLRQEAGMISGKRIVVVLIPLFVIAAWPGGHMGSPVALAEPEDATASRVVLVVDHWRLVGTLVEVRGSGRKPAALLLNKAAGTREAYAQLA